jgi:hypothetical protein
VNLCIIIYKTYVIKLFRPNYIYLIWVCS